MGLILLPLLILWLGVGIYAIRIGYQVLAGASQLSYALSVCTLAIVALLLYLYFGFAQFKENKELWAFEISMFFAANKFAFGIMILGLILHWFGQGVLTSAYLKPLPFIMIFTVSFGAMAGVILSDTFIAKFDIQKMH
ncbi:hypothetical protein KO533_18925 [Shewanella sp. NKUCC05_KAH]|jgi:hypothetical protein|uniref:hypothetical protein n=1 Tax=unclassified Shewanella TaxID=196818 RepID=UPI00048E512E|nr:MULTISPECIES: hypothetical protein [unclassified Shewanella]AVI67515.1 hypothetical protein CKQ84_17480 [Shewanella sp. WE21]MBW3528629.1 hypothetical protein [Shewanella sp. NKUCC05_KAH]